MDSKLIKLLKIESNKITTAFETASIEGEGTPQEISDRREGIIDSFLKKYFPFPHRITKGNIIDSYGNSSDSIDCIVLNPSHPYTIDPSNSRASIIFADGVDFAIEVKPDLANKAEIERGLKQITSVKKLMRKRDGILFHDDYNEEQLKYIKQIPAFIFAEKAYVDVHKLISTIVDYYVKNNTPPNEQFDLIIINNRMILFNSRKNSYVSFGDFEGIAFSETKENTLALFLLFMNRMPKSEPEIGENIMKIYLDGTIKHFYKSFNDLNKKLLSIQK